MNARSWFIDGRMRLMTMSFSKPADAPLDREEELGHAARPRACAGACTCRAGGASPSSDGHASAPACLPRAPFDRSAGAVHRAPVRSAGYASGHELAGQCTPRSQPARAIGAYAHDAFVLDGSCGSRASPLAAIAAAAPVLGGAATAAQSAAQGPLRDRRSRTADVDPAFRARRGRRRAPSKSRAPSAGTRPTPGRSRRRFESPRRRRCTSCT